MKSQNTIDKYLKTGWYYVNVDEIGIKKISRDDSVLYFISEVPIVTATNFSNLYIQKNKYGDNMLVILLNEKGKTAWQDATGKWIARKLAFVFKNEIIFTSMVNSKIESGTSVVYTKENSVAILEELKNSIEKEMKTVEN